MTGANMVDFSTRPSALDHMDAVLDLRGRKTILIVATALLQSGAVPKLEKLSYATP